MNNYDALLKAREVIEVNLAAHNIPARADVGQLVEGYPMKHAIKVLTNLMAIFEEKTHD